MDIRQLTPEFAVAPQITVADVAEAARLGFRTLVCNRPDGEAADQATFGAIAEAAEAAGMAVHFLPVDNRVGLTLDTVEALETVLAEAEAPVLAYCRSGTRSTFAWGLAMARSAEIDTLIAAAARGGYDISRLRPAMAARKAG